MLTISIRMSPLTTVLSYLILTIIFINISIIKSDENEGELDIGYYNYTDYVLFNYTMSNDLVNVTVFYECLCPGCKEFFSTQIPPVLTHLMEHVELHLIPFGFAEVTEHNGTYEFDCQHGPKECYGNKIHACAIDILADIEQAALFNSCLMKQKNKGPYDSDVKLCGDECKIDTALILECANSDRGSQLLKHYGDLTNAFKPTFVPTVLLNNSMEDEDHILDNLFSSVCKLIQNPPEQCHK